MPINVISTVTAMKYMRGFTSPMMFCLGGFFFTFFVMSSSTSALAAVMMMIMMMGMMRLGMMLIVMMLIVMKMRITIVIMVVSTWHCSYHRQFYQSINLSMYASHTNH